MEPVVTAVGKALVRAMGTDERPRVISAFGDALSSVAPREADEFVAALHGTRAGSAEGAATEQAATEQEAIAFVQTSLTGMLAREPRLEPVLRRALDEVLIPALPPSEGVRIKRAELIVGIQGHIHGGNVQIGSVDQNINRDQVRES
ncbi:hypothetical protein [Actinomadura sp. 6K520]|uniref:hypothetical protein n=1 Tax=Actinomadura sp. 6K520 TaxID=2530364 RepID=UPI0010439B89|nr:hypothetical protein [Actinomadura sp. 6K520]TDE26837.1 hypothetical protein E1289_24420 [Actinomadura sp. 6K520]